MPDIYDQEIEYLKRNPRQIYSHWNKSGPLFGRACNPNHDTLSAIGCLTQIRSEDHYNAQTPEITTLIREDSRIPYTPSYAHKYAGICSITLDDLPVFAEWQRKMDIEFQRTIPEIDNFTQYDDLSTS